MSTHWEHDGDLSVVAAHLVECAESWEPGARLIGNARADDIAMIGRHYLELLRENDALQADKARYEFCKRNMVVGHHGLAPGVTDVSMLRIPIDCTLLRADEIIDRAMLPGTAANVRAMIDAAKKDAP